MFELMTPTSGDIDHGDIASHALTRVLARALDEVDYGIVLARADATIVHANHHARRALEGEHPLQLLGQRLRTRETQDLGRLYDALLAAAERQRRCLLTLGRGTQPLAVVPVDAGVAAVLLGKAKVCEDLSIECFARSHDLTPAETRVLMALGAGVAPVEIAQHQGVKLSTVRTQIGAIRDKTGAASINALVHRVASLPPMVGALRH